eukprot:m.155224 g.155224  ORF g.155224 m.155224 type:complete len:568 (-) comp30931_c0_seq6:1489-3192(-)
MDSDSAPPLEWRELKAWYAYDFANSSALQVALAAFLPLLLQGMAYKKAGFPEVCENYIDDFNLSHAVFGEEVTMYVESNPIGCSDCRSFTPNGSFAYNNYTFANQQFMFCRGDPPSPRLCRDPTGTDRMTISVDFGGYDMDPTEYVFLFQSFSVLLQAFMFISFGAVGDYGGYRKFFFVLSAVIGAFCLILTVAVTPDLWWLGGVFMVFTNVFFGIANLLYNAWLPMLVTSHPDMQAATSHEEKTKLEEVLTNKFSTRGFMWGFVGGVTALVLCFPFILFMDAPESYQASVVLAGVWWLGFQIYPFLYLEKRPGPPLPPGETSLFIFSWKRTYNTFKKLKQLPTLAKFLVIWFFYSDGVSMILFFAVLAMYDMVTWCYLPLSIGLLSMLVFAPLFGGLGAWATDRVQHRYKWSTKNTLVASLIVAMTIAAYGLVGFSKVFGMVYGLEMVIAAVFFGSSQGVFQAYSRALMSQLIPRGYETQFFGLFAITDRGSSWIGPLVGAAIYRQTGDLRYTLFYIVAVIAVPTLFLAFLDVDKGRREAKEFSKQDGSSPVEVIDQTFFKKVTAL